MESAATALQVRFETAVVDQEPLHVSGCEGTNRKTFSQLEIFTKLDQFFFKIG